MLGNSQPPETPTQEIELHLLAFIDTVFGHRLLHRHSLHTIKNRAIFLKQTYSPYMTTESVYTGIDGNQFDINALPKNTDL